MIDYQKSWAMLDVNERIKFRDRVIAAVQEIYPHYIVRPFEAGDSDRFFVGNKQDDVRITAPLRDLYIRFCLSGKEDEDLKETIFTEYAGMLNLADDAAIIEEQQEFTWSDAREYVRPELVRNDEMREDTLHLPFGADVSTVLIIDRPQDQMNYFISQKMLDLWDMTLEDVYKVAMDNLGTISDGLEIVGTRTPHEELWNDKGHEWSSSCLLLPNMRNLLAETIGSPFRFAIPSRHRFYAWIDIDDEQRQSKMIAKLEREIDLWPKYLTTTIYEVDTQGQISIVKPQPTAPIIPTTIDN